MGAKSALGSVEPAAGLEATEPRTTIRRSAILVDPDPAFWRTGLRSKMFRPVKRSTTIRLDADVLDWLKSAGKGYQTRLNAILRKAMHKAMHKAMRKDLS